MTTINFVVDTGSERSFLGWEDATSAGINAESLPFYPKPTLGFGGVAEAKHLREPCFLFVAFGGNVLETVELTDGILVYRPSKTKGKHWKAGPSVSILGRDFLRRSGWTLVVDFSRDQLYLEKPSGTPTALLRGRA